MKTTLKAALTSVMFMAAVAGVAQRPARPDQPQNPHRRMSVEERAANLKERLELTQEQTDSVIKIMNATRTEFAAEGLAPEKRRELFLNERTKINAILTPEQQVKYKELAPPHRGMQGQPRQAEAQGKQQHGHDKKKDKGK
ncbi:MAG: hypothetical protein LBH06_03595 [Rikenellaceae bacterium]|jgi:Spy/CpxP family protein refolding chaperone|nr:hypothetical protein [Rikenellaceae bacterium]